MVRHSDSLNKPSPLTTNSEMHSLIRQWWGFIAAAIVLIAFGYPLLARVWHPTYAIRWAALAAIISVYQIVMLRRSLHLNHPPNNPTLLATLGPANWLSLFRGLLISAVGGFLFSPWPEGWLGWLPTILYLIATIIDYLDGIVARVSRHITELGGHLDVEMDALGILVVPLLAVLYNQLPIWYLLVSVARYLFMLGVWLRQRQGKPIYDLTPSHLRRMMAGFQMGMLCFVLAPVFTPPGTWIAATVFMTPLITGFIRDWLVVSGAINPTSESYTRIMDLSEAVFRRWMPLVLRFLTAGLVLGLAWHFYNSDHPYRTALIIHFAICAIMLILGVAVRIFAGLAMVVMGLVLPIQEMSVITIVVGASTLLVMGSGRFSLWAPEEYPLNRRFGGSDGETVSGENASQVDRL